MFTLPQEELSHRIDVYCAADQLGFHEAKRAAIRDMLRKRTIDAESLDELKEIVEYVIAYML